MSIASEIASAKILTGMAYFNSETDAAARLVV